MNKKDKLVQRFLSSPKDFEIDELSVLLKRFGFELSNKGATSGSRIAYINKITGEIIRIHKPHPGKVVKHYALKEVLKQLEDGGYI